MDEPVRIEDPSPKTRETGLPPQLILPATALPDGLKWLAPVVNGPVAKLLAIDRVNTDLEDLHALTETDHYIRACLARLGLTVTATGFPTTAIPATGPLVVVANHPIGGPEGLALLELLGERRPDLKVIANGLLTRLPQLAPKFISVNPFGWARATTANATGYRQAGRWLQDGGSVLVFPSGEVASWQWRRWQVSDPPWHPHIARMIDRADAPTLPIHIHGRNAWYFHLAGMIHPMGRTLLLARQMYTQCAKPLKCTIGDPIPAARLRRLPDPSDRIAFLQRSVEKLRNVHSQIPKSIGTRHPMPLAPPRPASVIAAELANLPETSRLAKSRDWVAYGVTAQAAPESILEIGRLREEAFRAADEGTGRDRDLDRYDPHYEHLLLWHRPTQRLAGAYRVGRVDTIIRKYGLDGLYTHSLFRFDHRFFNHLGPAIELGRSFICTEFQKQPMALATLWRGIGQIVARAPRYTTLFGPVSISQAYRPLSRHLLVSFLKRHRMATDLERMVRARKPFRRVPRPVVHRLVQSLASIDDVSMRISDMEHDSKGVPVLIRQYLKLDGRFLSFNVDPQFANVVDGLVIVDLRRTDSKLLTRFMGADGLAAFQAHHNPDLPMTKAG